MGRDETPQSFTPAADTASSRETLEFDLFCQRCEYNLRTLRRNGRCPECGTPISLSIQAHLLEFADPLWIGRMALGGRIVILALLAFVVVVVPFIASANWNWHVFRWVLLIDGVFCLALFGGAWILSIRNPALARLESRCASRRVLRAAIIATLVGVAAGGFAWLTQTTGPVLLLQQAVLGPAGLSGTAALCGLALYAASLARRLEERRLLAYGRGLAIAYALLWLVFVAAFAKAWISSSDTAGFVAFLAALLGLPCGLMILCLPAQLVKALRRFRSIAEANFSAALAATNADGNPAPGPTAAGDPQQP